MLAAIEIYNKPQIEYRDECFTILLINSWELLLKAILSKNKQRIYYPKERHRPYRTFSAKDALRKARPFFPPSVDFEPTRANISQLQRYRDTAIHFYNQAGFGVVIYGLAQTSIVNYRDLMLSVFGVDVADKISISLLPLSFRSQPDPIVFLRRARSGVPGNKAVAQFVDEIAQITKTLESDERDTGRFLTTYTVNLKSGRSITTPDLVVGVGEGHNGTPTIIERRMDPNITHPLRRKDILEKVGGKLSGVPFNQYTFEAIAWKCGWKSTKHLCWRPFTGSTTQYSAEIPSRLRRMTKSEISEARHGYRGHLAESRRQNRRRREAQ